MVSAMKLAGICASGTPWVGYFVADGQVAHCGVAQHMKVQHSTAPARHSARDRTSPRTAQGRARCNTHLAAVLQPQAPEAAAALHQPQHGLTAEALRTLSLARAARRTTTRSTNSTGGGAVRGCPAAGIGRGASTIAVSRASQAVSQPQVLQGVAVLHQQLQEGVRYSPAAQKHVTPRMQIVRPIVVAVAVAVVVARMLLQHRQHRSKKAAGVLMQRSLPFCFPNFMKRVPIPMLPACRQREHCGNVANRHAPLQRRHGDQLS
jgi:hypothetical protein